MNVPGYLLRSFQVDSDGERDFQAEHAEVTHATPFTKRWGGWYITGCSEKLAHLGNLFGQEENARHERDSTFRGTLASLSALVDLGKYPTAHSDIVAIMVLDHQAQFQNLVTRVHYEHRLNCHSDAEEQLARYALMLDEAPFLHPITGSTGYAAQYQSMGCRDGNGRNSLDLNLKTRLIEHRICPLIRSRSFQSLPDDVKSR